MSGEVKNFPNNAKSEKQIGEGSFGVVYKGTTDGNDVVIKKMKDVDDSPEAMAEFAKEVAMLDKFRGEQVVHFYGACTVPKHVTLVTQFTPCASMKDCIKKTEESDEKVKEQLMLDAAKWPCVHA